MNHVYMTSAVVYSNNLISDNRLKLEIENVNIIMYYCIILL